MSFRRYSGLEGGMKDNMHHCMGIRVPGDQGQLAALGVLVLI